MAHPVRVIVRTPPPSLEETARKFGISNRELERVKRLVHRIVARMTDEGELKAIRQPERGTKPKPRRQRTSAR